jgi:hypothetical protein
MGTLLNVAQEDTGDFVLPKFLKFIMTPGTRV